MKKISIKWVAFWIFIAALIGLGAFLIVRECNYNKKTECEVVLIKPDSDTIFIDDSLTWSDNKLLIDTIYK